MKKLALLAVVAFNLTGCTNDEELFAGFEPPFSASGKWKLTAMQVETPVDINGDGIATTDYMTETGCYQDEFLEFYSDATGMAISNSYLNLTVEGEFPEVSFTSECVEEISQTAITNYTIENGVITITEEDGTILTGTLEGNKITFVIPEGQIYFDEEMNVLLTEDLTLVYTQQ